jgi:hypothetical protein
LFVTGFFVLVFVLVAVVTMCTSWRGVGLVLRRPGGRPGPCTCRERHPCRSRALLTSGPDLGLIEGVARTDRQR